MSLGGTLRGLAAEIGKNRTPTGAEAAPAKLRHRTGTIDAYTAGALTASVQIGADVIDAPFLATYTPTVGDAVSVLINNGSPVILGAVNKAPAAGGGVIGRADYTATTPGSIGGTGSVGSGPLTLVQSFGDDSSIGLSAVTYGLAYLAVGWYQVAARVDVDSAVAGDVLRLTIFTGGSEIYRTSAVALAAGVASLSACSPPLYRDPADGDSVSFSISNEANRGTISVNNTLTVVRFAG